MRDDERLAESIVSALSAMALRVECRTDTGDICYAVRSPSLKLRSIVLNRAALGRLLAATDGPVKIEYMKRDLLRTAVDHVGYRYPRSAGTTLSLRSGIYRRRSPAEACGRRC